jgi:S-adenosylmethionine-diacylgycerolhomoserine-N-methlytransferase
MAAILNQAEAMDRMYRVTRHVYDLSRKYYLLGRDRLLREMDLRPADRVLEVGCGTARNLVKLARLHPSTRLYGLDASAQMLETAQQQVRSSRLADQIVLRQCLAEDLHFERTFGLAEPFDAIFFSYSLSMIPTWQQALHASLGSLKPGQSFYIVDFWDQAGLPGWFQDLLKGWLKLFHVHHRPELIDYLRNLQADGHGELTLSPIAGRYAFLARFSRAAAAVG